MSNHPNRLTPEDIARMRQSAAADPAYRPRSRPQSAAPASQHRGSQESHPRRPASQGNPQPQPPGRPSSEPAGRRQRPSNGPFEPPLEPIADDSPRMPPPPPGGWRRVPQGPSTEPPEHGEPPRLPTGGGTPRNHQNGQARSRPPNQSSEGQYGQSRPQPNGGASHGHVHRDHTPTGHPISDNSQHDKPPPTSNHASTGDSDQPGPSARHERQHPKHGHGHDSHPRRGQQDLPPRSRPASHSKQGYQPPPDEKPPPPYSREDNDSQGDFKSRNTRPQTDDGRRFQPSPFPTTNGTLALIHPDSLKWILLIIIAVGGLILAYFFVIKWSVIDIKNGIMSLVSTVAYGTFGALKSFLYGTGEIFSDAASSTFRGVKAFVFDAGEITSDVTSRVCGRASGAWAAVTGWASGAFASQQQRSNGSSVVNVPLLNPFIDTWAPAIQVAQHMAEQMRNVIKVKERNIVTDPRIKQVCQRNEQYTKELASTLSGDYLWVDFLVEDIENRPLSVSCWPTPSNQSYTWFNPFHGSQVARCRHKLIGQLEALTKALQDAHDSRSKLLDKVSDLLETDLWEIRNAACEQRDQYRRAYSKRLKDMKPGASDSKEVGSFLGKLAQLFGVGDSTCRMVEADYSTTAAKLKIMDDEVKYLASSLKWLGGIIKQWEAKSGDAASQEAADDTEKVVVKRVKEWLQMVEKYYQEM